LTVNLQTAIPRRGLQTVSRDRKYQRFPLKAKQRMGDAGVKSV